MADRPEPSISVVVVTFNSAALLPDLVASLDAGMAGTRWQLVVVDNASSDSSLDVARELVPDVVAVSTGRNAGYAAGINVGIAASAPCDAFLILNPDVRLEPDCARTLFEALDADIEGADEVVDQADARRGVGIAVPALVDGDGELILSIRRDPSLVRAWADALVGAERAGSHNRLGEIASDPAEYASSHDVDWAEGSTLMVSARCSADCGPWDESFFLYSEETEFALRARDHGFTVRYVPSARATHLEGGSATSPGLWALLVLNKVRLFRRRHGRAPGTAFWLAMVLREGSRAALGKAPSRRAVRALLSPSRMRETPGPHVVR